jgi:RND family efflux transporter MFP subunit
MNHSESFGDMTQRAGQSGSSDNPQSIEPQSTAASPEETSKVEDEETSKVEEADIDTTPEQPRSRFPLRRQRSWILAAGGVVLLVGAGLGWRWWQTSSAQEQPSEGQPAAIPVKIAPVRSGLTAESSEYVAFFEARQVVNLRPQIDGRVSQILVQEGAQVRAGTPIVQLGPAEQVASVQSNAATIGAAEADINAARADISAARANVNAARADTNAAQADVNTARADVNAATNTIRALEAQRTSDLASLEFNLAQYRRNAQLFSEGAISRQNLDDFALRVKTAQATLSRTNADIRAQRSVVAQRQSTVNQRQAAVAQRQSTVNQAQATVAQSQATAAQREQVVLENQANTRQQQARLDYYTVIAPFDGTVGDILEKVGDYVTPETDLVRMTQNRSLEVNISVPVEQAPQLRLGLPVELINAQDQTIGTSRISFIAPNINTQNQLVLIKSVFNNSAGRIRTDQYTRARVIWSQRPGISIPVTSVTRLGGESFVYVAQDGQPQQGKPQLIARQKLVELGPIQGNNYQVLKGLKPGERLVTSGILQLQDGAAIAPGP